MKKVFATCAPNLKIALAPLLWAVITAAVSEERLRARAVILLWHLKEARLLKFGYAASVVAAFAVTRSAGPLPNEGNNATLPAIGANLMSDMIHLNMRRLPTWQDFIPKMKYRALYGSATLRGDQDPLPWNLQAEIHGAVDKGSILMDVGCGSAIKLVGLASSLSQVVAVEPSSDMRLEAERNFASYGVKNGVVLDGEWKHLPVPSDSVNVVTSMLAGFFVEEAIRVLKPGGKFILETVGPRDKVALKTNFGVDEHGLRGQYLHFEEDDFLAFIENSLRPYFMEVKLRNGFWDTYYTVEGLRLLLSETPIVRNFDAERDKEALLQTAQQNMTPRGIKATQNRVLVICSGRL